MGKYKDEHGKTKVGAFLQGLGDVGKPILQAAAGLTGQGWLNNIAAQISTSKDISEAQKSLALELFKLDIEDVKNARDNETQRDISEHSSWLSKNIHELIALVVVGFWIITWFKATVIDENTIIQAVLLILGYLYGRSQPQK